MAGRGREKKKRDEGLEGGSDGGDMLQPRRLILPCLCHLEFIYTPV